MIIKPRRFLALICPVRLRGTLTSRKLKQLKVSGFYAASARKRLMDQEPARGFHRPGRSEFGFRGRVGGAIVPIMAVRINKLITVLSNQEMPEWDFQTPKDLIGYPKCYLSLVSLFYVYACYAPLPLLFVAKTFYTNTNHMRRRLIDHDVIRTEQLACHANMPTNQKHNERKE